MNTNKKVLFIIFSMLGSLSLAIVANVWIQFINFGDKMTVEKANSIAESVRDGLTSHMVLGAMDKKDLFLNNMIKHQHVKTLRVIRSKENMEDQKNTNIQYAQYDNIEKEVLKTGKSISQKNNNILRITIPYIAHSNSQPDCLNCHTNVDDGNVLGAITLEFNTNEITVTTYKTIAIIVLISVFFVLIAFGVANFFIKPYIKLFDDLEEGISKAYRGDFSHLVRTTLSDEAGNVAKKLNDLSEIFRFKKTIELDPDIKTIYERIAYILEHNFKITKFAFFEHNTTTKKRKCVYKSKELDFINISEMERSKESCRAFRTGDITASTDFHKVCKLCYLKEKESLCLPFNISEELALTILIYEQTAQEIEKIKSFLPIITNYIELAEPVLQTKILMNKLHKTSLIDPLSGLYNRRFLDDFLETDIKEYKSYSILMIDIDFFKQVNDTYGHNIGDEVIVELSNVLKENTKGSDLAVRYGGEEFLIITFNTTNQQAEKIATNIKNSFAKKVFKTEQESFSKTLSIGIASIPQNSQTPWQCIKFADVALYNAKNNGRNKVVIFSENMYNEELI